MRPSLSWLIPCMLLGVLTPVAAQSKRDRYAIEIEGSALWQNRNDVRIPNATGTTFSLVDAVGTGPYGAYRVEVDFDVNERHGFRAVFAPLEIEDDASLTESVRFAGETFAPDVPTEATYQFSSYRFTYRYRFYDGPKWNWRVGFTGFIRDARIALEQEGTAAEDTDLGFVPLAHLRGEARISERLRLTLDLDALGASQGRAIDFAAKLGYSLSERWELAFGYRVIEGGADVDQVYNFAWLNFAVASLRYRF
jgi:hypothetical protein